MTECRCDICAQVQNPVSVLGEYLMQASMAEELDRNPLMSHGNYTQVDLVLN